ncbi:MAG TPA: hypothetical protein DCQ06_03115 [Myxococcales bacterium]|nr:hypothetical protein [Myxococcales bacterium]HAN30565.1 hypothetical protein [Myxococcales bacterium]
MYDPDQPDDLDGHSHQPMRLIDDPWCTIDSCDCGTVHVHTRTLSVRLTQEQFLLLARSIGVAAHRLDSLLADRAEQACEWSGTPTAEA